MLILASQSPRRKELLRLITPDFDVISANIDEEVVVQVPSDLAKELSKLKAYEIFKTHPNDTILACDTIVIIDDKVLNKPKDKAEARKMLEMLSGRRHHVISGFTILSKDREINRNVMTEVYFNKLSDETIERYIASGSPFDKAGGYGIQDEAFGLVDHIVGSYYNVMGLPVEELKKYLK
jgi:septum formation protein